MKKSKEINNNEPINTDSDDSSSDEFETDSNVVIGFVDDSIKDLTADEKLHSRLLLKSPFFTSKLGGKPSWLNYNDLSSLTTNLKCSNCQFQMSFLLQIYAPITEQTTSLTTSVDDSFHRVLYVFVCNNNDCVSHGFKVFRSQLNRTNEFYSFDAPPSYEDGLESAEQCLVSFYSKLSERNLFNLCSVCGLSCSKKCAKCSFSFYCSSAHQVHDWQKLNHKEICSKYLEATKIQDKIDYFIKNENKEKEELPSNVFSEYEILIEPEVLDLKKKESFKKYDETSNLYISKINYYFLI